MWDVGTILENVKKEHEVWSEKGGAEAYGEVMDKLDRTGRRDIASRVIRHAVLAACRLPPEHPVVAAAASRDRNEIKSACAQLVTGAPADPPLLNEDLDYWDIPPSQVALARWVKDIVEKRRTASRNLPPISVITPNFDELFEVALRRLGMRDQFKSFNLVGNQYPGSSGEPVQIWHVHGTWSDQMIHSPAGLTADRTLLAAALRRRFDGALVLVLGYGGWNDIVFGTLGASLAAEAFDHPPEIYWSFFESEDAKIREKYRSVFERLSPILARLSTQFYKGIELNSALPALLAPNSRPPAVPRPQVAAESNMARATRGRFAPGASHPTSVLVSAPRLEALPLPTSPASPSGSAPPGASVPEAASGRSAPPSHLDEAGAAFQSLNPPVVDSVHAQGKPMQRPRWGVLRDPWALGSLAGFLLLLGLWSTSASWSAWFSTQYDPEADEAGSVLGGLPRLMGAEVEGKVVGWSVIRSQAARRVTSGYMDGSRRVISGYTDGDRHYAHLVPPDGSQPGPGLIGPPHGDYYVVHNYGDRPVDHLKVLITTPCSLVVAEERGNAKARWQEPSKISENWLVSHQFFGPGARHLIGYALAEVRELATKTNDGFAVHISSLPPGGEVVLAQVGPCTDWSHRFTSKGRVDVVPKPERLELRGSNQGGDALLALDLMGELERAKGDAAKVKSLIDYLGRTRSWLVQASLAMALGGRRDAEFGEALCGIAGGATPRDGTDDRWVRLVASLPLGPWYSPWVGCLKRAAQSEPQVLESLAPRAGAQERRDQSLLSAYLDLLATEPEPKNRGSLYEVGGQVFGDPSWCPRLYSAVAEELTRPQNSLHGDWSDGLPGFLGTGAACPALAEPARKNLQDELCWACRRRWILSGDLAVRACQDAFEKLRLGRGERFEEYLWSCFKPPGEQKVANADDDEQGASIIRALPSKLDDPRWVQTGRSLLASGLDEGSAKKLELALRIAASLTLPRAQELLQSSWRQEWVQQPKLLPAYLEQARRAGVTLPKSSVLSALPNAPRASRDGLLRLARKDEFTVKELYELWHGGEDAAYPILRDRLNASPGDKPGVVAHLVRDVRASADPDNKFVTTAMFLLKELSEDEWCALRNEALGNGDVETRVKALQGGSPCLLEGVLAAAGDENPAVRKAAASALSGLLVRDRQTRAYSPRVEPSMGRIIDTAKRLAADRDESVSAAARRVLCNESVGINHFIGFLKDLAKTNGQEAAALQCISGFPHWNSTGVYPDLLAVWSDVVPGVLKRAMASSDGGLCADAARFVGEHCVKALSPEIVDLAGTSAPCGKEALKARDKLNVCEAP